ncbi:MAG: hypothetical protein EXR98_00985 [Gemmataceae bacterium]|nr:hypothetical protein [Gemmataceae bacterium]
MKTSLTGKKIGLVLLLLAGFAGLAYWQREQVLAWYHVRQLSYACQEDRESCAKKVAALKEAALPRVMEKLQDADAMVCANMQHALFLIIKDWSAADPRMQQVVESLHVQFEEFSPAGREKVMLVLTAILQQDGPKPLPPQFTKTISEVLTAAEKRDDLRGVSLQLAAELIDCVQPGQWVDVCRGMAERGLKDSVAGTRVAALQLLLREPMRKNQDLIALAVPLLRDEAPAVRRAALLALAAESDYVREEQFLPLLHDDDPEVQYLCQIALRKRGLNDDDLRVARMIGDKNPATRRRVLNVLHQMPELNLSEWLRRLSQDPAAEVRAAAVRAAGDYPQVDLIERLREIADSDPSDTVRQNARYYLQQRALRTAAEQR